MHNCRLTRSRLLELVLDEVTPDEAERLRGELNHCPGCAEEFVALKNTWRLSAQALTPQLLPEEFWAGHHARLQGRLRNNASSVAPEPLLLGSRLGAGMRTMATASVRVPVPIALALMLAGGLFVLVMRSRGPANISSPTPATAVEIRTVQVPIVQEKVITRVVYVNKQKSRPTDPRSQFEHSDGNVASSIARVRPNLNETMSLVGFKPTDQIKLTIIKGSHQDEK